ncbi:MetQ/NlpA family ABC transporter substrate-binding protein [Ignatzschineria sp. F8392]|uniref:MetQ/NlpA family ABC transporter substrate-binding protein n=1 Tax=Ignatzschineria sp. F8392 TaxID=1980117 RepID=UPI001E6195A9|nr:MetQ/NlpA family ABC transporter substrate-binding protein [Ignatzschineria sp. F8392]
MVRNINQNGKSIVALKKILVLLRKPFLAGALVGILTLGLVGCSADHRENEIVMGVSPGPYNELFDEAIAPILEAEGYTIKRINFSALIESNIAMLEDAVDVVVAQHAGYMKVFNEQRGTNLVALAKIPTVPAGIFSNRHQQLVDINEEMTILIPQDASNAARAYGLLAKAGWITLASDINLMAATRNDIVANPYHLNIKEVDSHLIPRVLDDADFAVIPGSIVWLGQMDASKVLLQEDLLEDLYLQVVVLDKNRDSDWAKAIIAAYQSPEFKRYMEVNNQSNYWILPPELNAD